MKKVLTIGILLVIMLLAAGCSDTSENNATGDTVADTSENTETKPSSDEVTVYFFWGDGCPHCAKEKPFLESLENEYPELDVKMFETYSNPQNVQKLKKFAAAYGFEVQGVPVTFIGEEHWVGFNEQKGQKMEEKIQQCVQEECIHPEDTLE